MYVRALGTDEWHGRDLTHRDMHDPTWPDIEAAIRKLDGRVFTMATIAAEGEAHLCVGGGSEGRYVVYATFDNWNFRTLTSAATESSKILLFIGGQEGDYPSNIVVPLQNALQAARTFAESGQIDPNLTWRDH
jgi:hypothetical protein